MNPLTVIGCGTGRSGTMSLARVIGRCRGAYCTHEGPPVLTWEYDAGTYREKLREFRSPDGYCDVYHGYLPYLPRFFADLPHLKVVCVERERDEVIDSFARLTAGQNRWMNHDGSKWAYGWWDRTFPKFPATSKREAIGMYCDYYHAEIRRLRDEHPHDILIITATSLDDEAGQDRLFDFLGIEQADRFHSLQTVHHVSPSRRPKPWETGLGAAD